MSSKAVQLFSIVLPAAMFLLPGCGNRPDGGTEISRSGSVQSAAEEIEWGREVDLNEMIAMAKSGRIEEIQWHVIPNILRARAPGGGIFHLRNENKGVDLRNTLLNEGVRIGKEGIPFRHVF